MNTLLIGGTGFIGSLLAHKLVARGDSVVSIGLTEEGHADGTTPIGLNLYEQSLPQELVDAADAVFILLGQIHPNFDIEQEKQTLHKIIRALQKSRARVYYFSTVMVYGNTPSPASEDTPNNPLDDYSRFKVAAEALLQDSLTQDRLTIFRLSNVYGSPKNRGFIGLVLNKLQEPKPSISLNGDGQQRRDYIFIDDLIRAILTVVDQPNNSGIVNMATGKNYSLIEVLALVSEVAGKTIDYQITDTQVNEPQDSLINNTRLKTVYDYSDFLTLKDGLKETLDRYQTANSSESIT